MDESRLLEDGRAGTLSRVRSWLGCRMGVGWEWGRRGIGKGDRRLLGDGKAGEEVEALRILCGRGAGVSWSRKVWIYCGGGVDGLGRLTGRIGAGDGTSIRIGTEGWVGWDTVAGLEVMCVKSADLLVFSAGGAGLVWARLLFGLLLDLLVSAHNQSPY